VPWDVTQWIFSNRPNVRLERLYFELMDSTDPRVRLYVYRQKNGQLVKPYIYRGPPISELESYLQREFDGGEFCIMVRRGETMLLNGGLLIHPPMNRREAR
jgi:hypothetical protein